jgi:hypothetical protein
MSPAYGVAQTEAVCDVEEDAESTCMVAKELSFSLRAHTSRLSPFSIMIDGGKP